MHKAKFIVICSSLLISVSTTVLAGQAPTLNGGANLVVNITNSGVVNAGGGVGGSSVSKQAIGSMLSGKVNGMLDILVDVTNSGLVNAGGGAEGTSVACQTVGTIGNACAPDSEE